MAKALIVLLLTSRSWDGTAPSALVVAIEVLWIELGQRLIRDELWTATAAELS